MNIFVQGRVINQLYFILKNDAGSDHPMFLLRFCWISRDEKKLQFFDKQPGYLFLIVTRMGVGPSLVDLL